jgi:taurine transport system ATP-binding protein
MARLELRSVSVEFGKAATPAIDSISLSVATGDFVVVLGPSGCGKTTLLNVAAGFQPPTRGAVLLDGVEIRGPTKERGMVFQKDALYPWLSARDNVAFALKLRGVPASERRERADAALEQVGLAGFGDHSVWQLSGGMRQRVGIARALIADPDFLLMDEPFGALDALTREKMHDLLLGIWSRSGKGVLLITHSVEEAVFLATRLVVMTNRPGRIESETGLDYGRRALAGDKPRAIKADVDFVRDRERVLDAVLDEAA